MVEKERRQNKLQRLSHIDERTAWLAFLVYSLFERQWFVGAIDPPPDMIMTRLLIRIYFAYTNHSAIPSKKEAATQIGVRDIKTARKYIADAVRRGYIEVVPSEDDRRVELLYPSELLMRVAESELRLVDNSIQFAMDTISRPDKVKTVRAKSASRSRAEAGSHVKKPR
jgi:DNA-binding MarR family transcriptional regulator